MNSVGRRYGACRDAGAVVEVIDIADGEHYVGDISKKDVLETFAKYVIEKHGRIDYLINNALPVIAKAANVAEIYGICLKENKASVADMKCPMCGKDSYRIIYIDFLFFRYLL